MDSLDGPSSVTRDAGRVPDGTRCGGREDRPPVRVATTRAGTCSRWAPTATCSAAAWTGSPGSAAGARRWSSRPPRRFGRSTGSSREAAFVEGRITGDVAPGQRVAVAVNGRIRAITRTYAARDEVHFWAVVPPGPRGGRGSSQVDVLGIHGQGGDRSLARFKTPSAERLVTSGGPTRDRDRLRRAHGGQAGRRERSGRRGDLAGRERPDRPGLGGEHRGGPGGRSGAGLRGRSAAGRGRADQGPARRG